MRGGNCRLNGDGDKILGASAVNSGVIEVYGGTLDMATYQAGTAALGGSCSVSAKGSAAKYVPAR